MIPNCQACSHCFMEPDDMNFVCGHPDAGSAGIYLRHAVAPDGHCGPDRTKFEQHPLRNPDGTLKSTEAVADPLPADPVAEQLEARSSKRETHDVELSAEESSRIDAMIEKADRDVEAYKQGRKAMFPDIARVWNAFVAYREHDEDGTVLDGLLLFLDGSGRVIDTDNGLVVEWDTCDEAVERLHSLAGIGSSGLDVGKMAEEMGAEVVGHVRTGSGVLGAAQTAEDIRALQKPLEVRSSNQSLEFEAMEAMEIADALDELAVDEDRVTEGQAHWIPLVKDAARRLRKYAYGTGG